MDGESNGKVGGELLVELFSAFEDLETQSAGILQFLKAKGLATDEELAPYLKQAADASNVRWLAARVRMDALLAAAIKDAEEEFARKVEERGGAHKESPVQRQDEPGEIEQKGANDAPTGARKPDVRKEEGSRQAQVATAEANSETKEDVAENKQPAVQATKAEKEEAKSNTTEVAAKNETPLANGRNDAAESKNDQKAA